MLCANSDPALNDVTYKELEVILHQAGIISSKFKEALDQKRLIAVETAQTGPCLDLRYLLTSNEQCLLFLTRDVIVIL